MSYVTDRDYTRMAGYYDLIMLAGYYDYDTIAAALAEFDDVRSVLEVGAGTGIILERLVRLRPELELAGVDLTPAMLDRAADRLRDYPHIALGLQDVVTLDLGRHFDVVFSYGGPMYFVPELDGGMTMISHIRGEEANRQALDHLAGHLPAGGRLLLGVQGPHRDYATTIGGELEYMQRITPIAEGFRKRYTLRDHGETVMEQTTDYRTASFADALDLLDKSGFDYQPDPDGGTSTFLVFTRR